MDSIFFMKTNNVFQQNTVRCPWRFHIDFALVLFEAPITSDGTDICLRSFQISSPKVVLSQHLVYLRKVPQYGFDIMMTSGNGSFSNLPVFVLQL